MHSISYGDRPHNRELEGRLLIEFFSGGTAVDACAKRPSLWNVREITLEGSRSTSRFLGVVVSSHSGVPDFELEV
jgi:hypothetical protein